jgi:hypothetical protein
MAATLAARENIGAPFHHGVDRSVSIQTKHCHAGQQQHGFSGRGQQIFYSVKISVRSVSFAPYEGFCSIRVCAK